jgi:type VI secretion system secreted protein Hcp
MSDIFMLIEKDGASQTEGAGDKKSLGAFWKPGHPDEIFVLGYDHKIVLPTDKSSGQITGSRKHHHVEILKLTDKTTPILYGFLTSTTSFKVSLQFYRNSGDSGGTSELYFSVTLDGSKIISIEMEAPDAFDEEISNHLAREKIKLSYDKIEWENHVCSTSGQDSWSEVS